MQSQGTALHVQAVLTADLQRRRLLAAQGDF